MYLGTRLFEPDSGTAIPESGTDYAKSTGFLKVLARVMGTDGFETGWQGHGDYPGFLPFQKKEPGTLCETFR